ncbi:MAG TPA: hypothetical protein V6D05_03910 [Stenomitos sp.]
MVAYVLGFVALSAICNGILMGMVRRAPVVPGPPRPHMMPEEAKLPLCS